MAEIMCYTIPECDNFRGAKEPTLNGTSVPILRIFQGFCDECHKTLCFTTGNDFITDAHVFDFISLRRQELNNSRNLKVLQAWSQE